MDPEEMFIPQGVPWEPTRTPIVPAARPPAPAMAPPPTAGQAPPKMDGTTTDDGVLHPVLLSNQVDEFGIVTVSLLKPSLEVDLGIRLKRVVGRGLLLDEFYNSTSLLHGTHLVADMKVLFINGCDCAELLVSEAMLMISSTVGEVTLVAAHQKVLFSAQATGTATTAQSTALVVSGATSSSSSYALPSVAQSSTSSTVALVAGQTPTPQHSIQSAAAAAAGTTTNTTTTTPPRAASPARSTKSTTSTTPPQRVKVVIHKPTKRSAVGLVVIDEPLLNGNAKTVPTIAKIEPQSLCDGTALKIGMRIRSVNGLQCYKKGDTLTKLKRAKATVYIEAEQLPQAPEEQAQKDEIVQDDASTVSRPRRFSWFSSRRLTTKRHDNYHATVPATTATAGPMINRSNSGEMA